MRRSSGIRESDIQAACIEWLEWHGWRVFRLNSGNAFVQGRCIKLCPPGTPDTVAFKPSAHDQGVRLVFFEFKRLGNKPTMQQYLRMQELELYGAKCYVVSSLDELEHILEQID